MSARKMSNKKYGLLVPGAPKTEKPIFQASRNVFGDDSDSDDELNKKPVLLRPSQNINRQGKISQEKALLEDPTVYQYDELYDSMVSKKEEKKNKSKEDKKPRYIENLLKTANKRKIENERRLERQIQKEREKEGDEFADKEVFVTSAYKKKLEEMRLEEEKEKREEYLENIGDVTKQKDLGGFYRHLYEQKLGTDKKIKDVTENKEDINEKESDRSQTPEKPETFKNSNEIKTSKKLPDKPETSRKRNYRKRKSSSDVTKQLSEGEIDDSEDEINRFNLSEIREAKRSKQEENIDADSDFSIDESSDEEEANSKNNNGQMSSKKGSSKKCLPDQDKESQLKLEKEKKDKLVDIPKDEIKQEIKAPKPKIDIWKKRTVGEAFDQALKRYYERKAARGI